MKSASKERSFPPSLSLREIRRGRKIFQRYISLNGVSIAFLTVALSNVDC